MNYKVPDGFSVTEIASNEKADLVLPNYTGVLFLFCQWNRPQTHLDMLVDFLMKTKIRSLLLLDTEGVSNYESLGINRSHCHGEVIVFKQGKVVFESNAILMFQDKGRSFRESLDFMSKKHDSSCE